MKKILLTGAMLMALSFTSTAQDVLYTQDFNALTVGNVGTDLTGVTPGQGDLYTFAVGGDESDFQIVANGSGGNGLQITAGDSPSATNVNGARFLWADGLAEAWADRTAGNDWITVEYSFYSGVVDGSTSLHRALLYAETGEVMGGLEYDAATGELGGLVYYSQNGQAGTYGITLSEGGFFIPENSWIKLGMAIDPSTGTVLWASPDIQVENEDGELEIFLAGFESEFAIGLEPVEFDFVSIPGALNEAASTAIYDNLAITADTEDLSTWLSTKPVASVQNTVAVYPNPATDVVNVKGSNESISAISIVDVNGRTVKTGKFNAVSEVNVNVSNLTAGVYMMTIVSDKGTVTKKVVKN